LIYSVSGYAADDDWYQALLDGHLGQKIRAFVQEQMEQPRVGQYGQVDVQQRQSNYQNINGNATFNGFVLPEHQKFSSTWSNVLGHHLLFLDDRPYDYIERRYLDELYEQEKNNDGKDSDIDLEAFEEDQDKPSPLSIELQ
jgi:hypothetical protein